jgi:hypothetical protein
LRKINPEHFRNYRVDGVVQVGAFLSRKCDDLNSVLSTTKNNKPEIMMKYPLHLTVQIFLMRKRKHHK